MPDRDPAAVGRPPRQAGRLRAGAGDRGHDRPPARRGQLRPAGSPPPATRLDDRHAAAVPRARRGRVRHRLRDRGPDTRAGQSPGTPSPWTPAGTGAAWRPTTGTTASAACRGLDRLLRHGHGLGLYPGQQLLLDTPAADSADPPVRELVTVAAATETSTIRCSAIAADADHPAGAHDRGPRPRTRTVVAGNIVPAVQGLRQSETFVIPRPGDAAARAGRRPRRGELDPAGPAARLPLLPGVRAAGLAGQRPAQDEDTSVPAQPEIVLTRDPRRTGSRVAVGVPALAARRRGPPTRRSPLTPEQYSPVLTSNGTTWYDYDGDGGTTIRFGDGTFGASPLPGTVFTVLYRSAAGRPATCPRTRSSTSRRARRRDRGRRPAPTRSPPPAARTPRRSRRSATGRRRSSARSRCASCRPRTTRPRPSRCPGCSRRAPRSAGRAAGSPC